MSFLGGNELEDTVRAITLHCADYGLPTALKLVSGVNENVETCRITVREDRDNFDYLYSIQDLLGLQGKALRGPRNRVNRFIRRYPRASFESLDLKQRAAQEQILTVTERWAGGKPPSMSKAAAREMTAIRRFLSNAGSTDFIAVGVVNDDALLAYSIDEVLPDGVCVSHFCKADVSYSGISAFLMEQEVQYLDAQGVKVLNLEQDLGIEGLRRSKMGYRPVSFLKKYVIAMKD
jgi:hypothetical protein